MECGKESVFAPYPRHEQAANNIIVGMRKADFGWLDIDRAPVPDGVFAREEPTNRRQR